MPTDLGALRAQIAILRHVKEKEAELKELKENARAAIEEAMGDEELGTLDGDVVVRWKRQKRTALSQKLLKEMYPEAFASCQDTIETRRFEIAGE